jgi:hypothetical protein
MGYNFGPMISSKIRRMVLLTTVLGSLSVVGTLWILKATGPGVGFYSDTAAYFEMATLYHQGRGMSAQSADGSYFPVYWYAPLYPWTLAQALRWKADLMKFVRYFNAALFGLTLLTLGLLVARWTHSIATTSLALVLGLCSRCLLQVHTMAWSEPLFIWLSLSGIFALAEYLTRQKRSWLAVSALCFGLAWLTRYAGYFWVGAGFLSILVLSPLPWRRRIVDGILLSLPAAAACLVWNFGHGSADAAMMGRDFIWHPEAVRRHFPEAVYVVRTWISPHWTSAHEPYMFVAELSSAVLLFWLFWPRSRRAAALEPAWVPERMLWIFISCYLTSLIATELFLDATTPLDLRLLAPVYPLVLVAALSKGRRLFAAEAHGRKPVIVFLLLALVYGFQREARTWILSTSFDGQGYSARRWTQSPLLAALKSSEGAVPIFSNADVPLTVFLGRPCFPIPASGTAPEKDAEANHQEAIATLVAALKTRHAEVAYFNGLHEVFSPADIARRIPLQRVTKTTDGELYRAKPPS